MINLDEVEVQKSLIRCLENFESFRFDSGAGAGKTYAVIECLRYILKTHLDSLQRQNQKVACITFTNVAVNEIKNRLGNSETIDVSTIHEHLWQLINIYQPELVELHKEKISFELEELLKSINDDSTTSKTKTFSNLPKSIREDIIAFAVSTESHFYKIQNLKSKEIRSSYLNNEEFSSPENLSDILKNITNFKYIFKIIYKINRYKECLKKIELGEYSEVIYDTKSTNDRLASMKFSHDTLLEYSYSMVKNFPVLKRIIIDTYPYFFVDEYQDTSSLVILILKELHDFSKSQERDFLVGYFGDSAQTIYGNGVGKKINEIHPDVTQIKKELNRRSYTEIINVINKIRNDDIEQKPFYNELKGNVEFYFSIGESKNKTDLALDFIRETKNKLKANRLDCLVLTNKLMSQLNGFGDIYDVYSSFNKVYFEDVNSELLSSNKERLSKIILNIYNFIDLYRMLHSDQTLYHDMFGDKTSGITFKDANAIVDNLKSYTCNNLNDLVESVSETNVKFENTAAIKAILKYRLNIDVRNIGSELSLMDNFRANLLSIAVNIESKEISNDSDDDYNQQLSKVEDFLKIPLKQWLNWIDFIDDDAENDIKYHTYHGTKGEQYQNVIIIMEDSFGGGYRGKNKFKNYFDFIQKDRSEQELLLENTTFKEELDNTKNLLYVACSRAIENLVILYLDDISSIECGVNYLFESSSKWPNV